jgi:diguanylate cyclase (GGDEF)-like protein
MTAHETSGATTGLIVRYVRQHGGDAAVQSLLQRADVSHPLAELEDESRWVSYRTRVRLFEAAVEVLGDPRGPFAMGASSLRSGLNPSLVLLLRALGSPRQVYRQLPRAVPKFTTTSTMEVVESGTTHATLRYRLHEGYEHSRLDCEYAQGLITMIPEIFGLPSAALVHDECESDGRPACVYHLTWARRRRLPWRRRDVGLTADPELVALRTQLEALQSAASDLVDSDDLDAALRRIAERAAAAVLAPAYLLAVHGPDGAHLVQSKGLDAARAAELGRRLLDGDDLGAGAVVVDVTSRRHSHGRLAALYAPGQRGPANERSLLAAYAGHAAAALDLLVALEESRRGESRSTALLELAHDLRSATDRSTVAEVVVTALSRLVSSDTSAVLLWDPARGELRHLAVSGFAPAERDVAMTVPVRVADTLELAEMLTRQEPTHLRGETVSPALGQLFAALGLSEVLAVPLVAGGELLGVATAGWRQQGPPPGALPELVARMGALGEYAATALENVRLLSAVRHQSLHDALTGLPNRVLFARELEGALRDCGPEAGVGVLFCDLDRFKHVNDVLGHAAGDELLRQVAARLRGVLRAGDVVGRLSGDEFALLLPGVPDPGVAEGLANRVVGCFAQPFRVEGRELRVTTSVGVALHCGVDGRGDLLLRAADSAMYDAKQRGRNQVALAGRDARTGGPAGDGQRSLEAELRAALGRDELRLFFMPIAGIGDATGAAGEPLGVRLSGAEALVRWQHPRLGLLPPGAFLPLAEEAASCRSSTCGPSTGPARPQRPGLDWARSRCTLRSTWAPTRSSTRGCWARSAPPCCGPESPPSNCTSRSSRAARLSTSPVSSSG